METQLRISNYPQPLKMTRHELIAYLDKIRKEDTKFVALDYDKKKKEVKYKRIVHENKWADHEKKPLVEFYDFATGKGVVFNSFDDIPNEDIYIDKALVVKIYERNNKQSSKK